MGTFQRGVWAKPVQHLDWFKGSELPDEQVFEGSMTAMNFRNGFGLHTLNALAHQSFEVSAARKPGVVLHCFLEGSTSADLAGKPMNLGRLVGQPVQMVLTTLHETEAFSRRSERNEYVRKVNICLSLDWLEDNGFGFLSGAEKEPQPDCRYEWIATGDEVRAMESLASHADFSDPVTLLQAESLALGLVAGCFAKLNNEGRPEITSSREKTQLIRMEELIRGSDKLPTLAEIASAGSVSQSTMRRIFQVTHGCSALSYARQVKLEMARVALKNRKISVAQAARVAGYGGPANFATAFRRQHGISPSEARHLVKG